MESSTSKSTTVRAAHPLAEARSTPIDRIPERTRTAVLSRILTPAHLVSSAFQSAI